MFIHSDALSRQQKRGIATTITAVIWWAADHYGRLLTAVSVIKDIPHLLHAIAPFATPVIALLGAFWFFFGDRIKSWLYPSGTANGKEPELKTKLQIHSALYGTGPDTDIDVTEKLQSMVRDGLVIPVANDLVPRDPDFGVKKKLKVEYSYGNPHRLHATGNENTRLVLPEDTWMRDELAKYRDVAVRDTDPQIYAEFCDDRGATPNKASEAYITLINRGHSDAFNVCIDPIYLKTHILNFPRLAYLIAPGKAKHRYPDITTSDNRTPHNIDVFSHFASEYISLRDLSLPELALPLRVTYQDVAHNLYEMRCELVFDPAAHARVRMEGQHGGIVVVSTRNHKFKKLATAVT